MAGQAEGWFKLADQDGDGAVGGAEAVRFFTRSGLPQDVLGQIWEFSSRGQAALNPMQFGVALRLVALAQASGGRLPPDQARLVAMGTGPQLPPPRLAGLTETPPTPSIPTYTPQITGLTPQPTGGMPYTAQMTGGMAYTAQASGARPPYPYMAQQGMPAAGPTGSGPPSGSMAPPSVGGPGHALTGGPISGGYTGALSVAAAGPTGGLAYPPGFTPPSSADMQRYVTVFASTDADRDGMVKGSECFPVFIQSGLDKGVLKRMWDLVAGTAGHLNRDQFVRCMFLMDGLRRGLQLPAVLPPGPWPQVGPPAAAGMTGAQPAPAYQQPVPATAAGVMGSRPSSLGGGVPGLQGLPASMTGGDLGSRPGSMGGALPVAGATGGPLSAESWSLSSQFGHKGAVKAIGDAYDQTLPKIPDPPGKIKYEGAALPDSGPSAVPDLDMAVSSMLAPADKARWETERAEALKKEQEQRQAEADAANQKARLAAYQEALSELVMYKSRIDVALLQAGDSAARLEREAEDLEVRYNRAQLAAQSQADAGSKARKQLQDLLARKAEVITKLQVLQQELEMAQNLNPEELVALEREVGGLMAQQAAAEARKAALDMQLDSGRKQKGLLSDRISELEMAAVAGEGELRRARDELDQLQGKVLSTEASSLSSEELGLVKPLLGKAASAYRRLYSTAAAAGIEVPYEANLTNVGSLVWLEQLMAGTADWVDDDTISGFSVVNALPELEGIPPALMRAAALAAAAAPPLRPNVLRGQASAAAAAVAEGKEGVAADASRQASNEAPAAAAAAAQPRALEKGEAGVEPAVAADPAAAEPAASLDSSKKAAANSSTASKATGVAAATAAVAAGAAVVAGAAKAGSAEERLLEAAAVPEGAAELAVPAAVAADDADLPASVEAPPAAAAAAAAAADDGDDDDAAQGVAGVEQSLAEQGAAAAAATAAAAAAAVEADAADIVQSPPPPAAAAAAAGTDGEVNPSSGVTSPPAAAPKTLLEDSDSEMGGDITQHSSGALPVALGAGGAAPFGALAGFDPSLYRLPDESRTLTQQHSIDSSYAGSFTAERRRSSIEAGHTGVSGASGFDDEPQAFGEGGAAAGFTGASVSGAVTAGSSAAGAAADMGFEDNAF